VELVEQDPDITLAELRGALINAEGVTVGVPAIFRMLKRLDFTYKKKTLVADERRKTRVRHARGEWVKHRLPAMREAPERLVFIYETSVRTNLTRLRGSAPMVT